MTHLTKLTTVLQLLDNKLPTAQILHDYCLTTVTPWQLPKPHNEFFFAHFSVGRTVHKITNNLLLILFWIVEVCFDCLTTNYQLPKSFMITAWLLWLLDNYYVSQCPDTWVNEYKTSHYLVYEGTMYIVHSIWF